MIFFLCFKKPVFLGILGPPYCGIGATIRICQEMLCFPYAGFFLELEELEKIFAKHQTSSALFKSIYGVSTVEKTTKINMGLENIMVQLAFF